MMVERKKQKKSISKSALVSQLQLKTDLDAKQAEAAYNTVMDVIQTALLQGISVRFPRIGTLDVKNKKGWQSRNPRTGEPVPVPDHKSVYFHVSKVFRSKLNPNVYNEDGKTIRYDKESDSDKQ